MGFIGDILGGGGGGGGGGTAVTSQNINTPAFTLSSGLTAYQQNTSLLRNGTISQNEFDARFSGLLGGVAGSRTGLEGLRSTIQPGFSQLRAAGLGQLGNAEAASLGTLREGLARRSIGGPFAADAEARTRAEFGQQKAQFESQAFLQELAANQQLEQQIQSSILAESALIGDALDRELQELGVASGFGAQAAQTAQSGLNAVAQLKAAEAQAKGAGIGSLLSLGLMAAGPFGLGAAGGIFGPAAAGGAAGAFSGIGGSALAPTAGLTAGGSFALSDLAFLAI